MVLENEGDSEWFNTTSLKLSKIRIFSFRVELSVHMRLPTLLGFLQKSQMKTRWIYWRLRYLEHYQEQKSFKALPTKSDTEQVWREWSEWKSLIPVVSTRENAVDLLRVKRGFHGFSGQHIRHEIKHSAVVLEVLCSFLTSCWYQSP